MLAAVLGEGLSSDDAQLRAEVLDEDRHGVRPEEHPEETVAELAAAEDVGGEVAGVDVGDGGYEGGAEIAPDLVAAEGCSPRLSTCRGSGRRERCVFAGFVGELRVRLGWFLRHSL